MQPIEIFASYALRGLGEYISQVTNGLGPKNASYDRVCARFGIEPCESFAKLTKALRDLNALYINHMLEIHDGKLTENSKELQWILTCISTFSGAIKVDDDEAPGCRVFQKLLFDLSTADCGGSGHKILLDNLIVLPYNRYLADYAFLNPTDVEYAHHKEVCEIFQKFKFSVRSVFYSKRDKNWQPCEEYIFYKPAAMKMFTAALFGMHFENMDEDDAEPEPVARTESTV